MANSLNTKSFRSLLLKTTLGLTISLILVVLVLAIIKINDKQHDEMKNNTWLWASILSNQSAPFLADNPKKTSAPSIASSKVLSFVSIAWEDFH